MNINLEDSPWLQVHFTLPNQTTKRRLVSCEGERRRIKNVIQGKQSFLAAKSKKSTSRTNFDRSKDHKDQKQTEKGAYIPRNNSDLVELGKLTDISTQQNNVFIDCSNETSKERSFTLPPLHGASTSMLSCQGQQSKSCNAGNLREKPPEKLTKNFDKYKPLSIATCYDLCEWKPSSSVCQNPARPLISILKQYPSQRRDDRPQGQTIDNSDTSGYETDNERTVKTTKRVRFAKGTIFRSSKGRRSKRAIDEYNDDLLEETESETFDGLHGLPFSEFIQRKRLERSLASKSFYKSKNHLTFLKEENSQVKRNQGKKRIKTDVHTLLPTIIN